MSDWTKRESLHVHVEEKTRAQLNQVRNVRIGLVPHLCNLANGAYRKVLQANNIEAVLESLPVFYDGCVIKN
jgi:hypothetical protein